MDAARSSRLTDAPAVRLYTGYLIAAGNEKGRAKVGTTTARPFSLPALDANASAVDYL